jgi:hypothetical protein
VAEVGGGRGREGLFEWVWLEIKVRANWTDWLAWIRVSGRASFVRCRRQALYRHDVTDRGGYLRSRILLMRRCDDGGGKQARHRLLPYLNS